MAKGSKALYKKREQLAHARGVRKGRKLGFIDGWDSAMHERDLSDEHALKALSGMEPVRNLPKEATSLEAMDAIIIAGPYTEMVDRVVAEVVPPSLTRKDAFTKPFSVN
jgi:hypothetical protein